MFNGRWNDLDDQWTIEEMVERQIDVANDGLFYMGIEDYLEQEHQKVLTTTETQTEHILAYAPLGLIIEMIGFSKRPLKVDNDRLIFKQAESLIVEKDFLAEALKQVGKTAFVS